MLVRKQAPQRPRPIQGLGPAAAPLPFAWACALDVKHVRPSAAALSLFLGHASLLRLLVSQVKFVRVYRLRHLGIRLQWKWRLCWLSLEPSTASWLA